MNYVLRTLLIGKLLHLLAVLIETVRGFLRALINKINKGAQSSNPILREMILDYIWSKYKVPSTM